MCFMKIILLDKNYPDQIWLISRVAQNAKIWKCFAPYAKSNANDIRDHANFKEIAIS